MSQQGSTVTTTPEFWADVEVFEVKPGFAEKRRKIGKKHCEAHDVFPIKGQNDFSGRSRSEQGGLKLFPGNLNLMA
jgi:hypothetical protein